VATACEFPYLGEKFTQGASRAAFCEVLARHSCALAAWLPARRFTTLAAGQGYGEMTMLWFGTLLALALAVVGYGAWRLLQARQVSLGNSIGLVALALWVTGVAVVWLTDDKEAGSSERTQSLASLAWPGTIEPQPVNAPSAAPTTGVQAAPIESLVAGLEARLAAQPNDAQGWTLLAQSYAYTANEEAADRAVRRAVELGVDEAMLRDRVAQAKRSAHSVDWVDRALNTGQYR
jgi:cytochrome c-type biogenesis protein CcmH/NrfG